MTARLAECGSSHARNDQRGYSVVSADDHNSKQQDVKKHRAYGTLVVELKFGRNRERIITDLKRVSKPGRRVYARKDRLPRVLGGMGTAILSTSRGVMLSYFLL